MIAFRPGDMCIFPVIEEIVVNKVGKIVRSDGNMVLIRMSNGHEEWVQSDKVNVIRTRQPEED